MIIGACHIWKGTESGSFTDSVVSAFGDSLDLRLCGARLAAEGIYSGSAGQPAAADDLYRKNGADTVRAAQIPP